ncbi:hypothetical protein CRENPOLYSF2_1760004 [Crenothrix polyspora]|uniref:Uncharacterized protein n=1 Tax=Crenothrix polyspora TaxID=360316 RepID=A0A1R4H4A5_9GAMM|nr:hypothetical protein CRENPOLYSF2_1760004 [Crenothrix polyspora]
MPGGKCASQNISKLPVRQLTETALVWVDLGFSKLPVRQLTHQHHYKLKSHLF